MRKKTSSRSATAPKDVTTPATVCVKRILVPLDFSKTAMNALHYALPFAQQFGASLHLVHIYEAPTFMAGYQALPIVIPDDQVMQKARIQLDLLAKSAAEWQVPVECFVRKGKAYQEIVDFAREQKIDLIIISTHGYTGLKHTLLGSTAERVVRHASCPVLIVR